MTTFVNTGLPKICSAHVGQIVRLPDPETGEVQPELFLLAVIEQEKQGRKKCPYPLSAGFDNEERYLLFISLSTGQARKMPHLSRRADLTELKPGEVLSEAAWVPVLLSAREEMPVRVTLATCARSVQHYINLGRPFEAEDLLQRLAITADHVTEIKTVKQLNEEKETKSRGRMAVAAGPLFQDKARTRREISRRSLHACPSRESEDLFAPSRSSIYGFAQICFQHIRRSPRESLETLPSIAHVLPVTAGPYRAT